MAINYITSDVLIAELISDYNIQSSDFIGRAPMWIINALGELGIYQAKVQTKKSGTFGITLLNDIFSTAVVEIETDDIYGFELPYNCHSIEKVELNGVIAHKKSKIDSKEKSIIMYRPMRVSNEPIDKTMSPQDLFMSLYNKSVAVESGVGYDYVVNGNYIHTSIPNGTYTIYFNAIPTVTINGLEYPYIMDNALLKKAIKCYILKMMLMRGYIHPLLNLRDNNPFTNPALELEQLRHRVKTSCNKYDVDERNHITNPLNGF